MTREERLDEEVASRLAARFATQVVRAADLPAAREPDLHEACGFSCDAESLRLTCAITGSTYDRSWDGSEAGAAALVDDAAKSTAYLLRQTPHYAWMHSSD